MSWSLRFTRCASSRVLMHTIIISYLCERWWDVSCHNALWETRSRVKVHRGDTKMSRVRLHSRDTISWAKASRFRILLYYKKNRMCLAPKALKNVMSAAISVRKFMEDSIIKKWNGEDSWIGNLGNRIYGAIAIAMGGMAIYSSFGIPENACPITETMMDLAGQYFILEGLGDVITGKHHYVSSRTIFLQIYERWVEAVSMHPHFMFNLSVNAF